MGKRKRECRRNPAGDRGYVMIAFTLALFLILGAGGLAFDVGRMYITKNESQSFCDSAAIEAALKLDGTSNGIEAAKAAARAVTKGWQFGTTAFTDIQVDFATSLVARDFVETPAAPANYDYARVRTRVSLPMALMPAVTGVFQSSIAAVAVARQVSIPGLGQGVFPFAPIIPPEGMPQVLPPGDTGDPNAMVDAYNMIPARCGAGDASCGSDGLRHGGLYTFRGPASLNQGWPQDADKLCWNDSTEMMWALRNYIGEPQRGYLWPRESAASIRDVIVADIMPEGATIELGDSVVGDCDYCRDHGVMQTEVFAIEDRIEYDTDETSEWFEEYWDPGDPTATPPIPPGPRTGNYRRIVVVPLQTAYCGGTIPPDPKGTGASFDVLCPTDPDTSQVYGPNMVVGWAEFFLPPASTYGNPQHSICAEYIGPHLAGSPGAGHGTGLFTVKLVE